MYIEESTSELQHLDSHHHLHPFTDPKAILKEGARVITRADGIYLWDSEGEKILDSKYKINQNSSLLYQVGKRKFFRIKIP